MFQFGAAGSFSSAISKMTNSLVIHAYNIYISNVFVSRMHAIEPQQARILGAGMVGGN